jgi:2-haloacid dehalogenase
VQNPLQDIEIVTFDCYGTLIDWETGILNSLRTSISLRREEEGHALNLYSRIEPEIQAAGYKRYREVLREVLTLVAHEFGREVPRGKEYAIADSIKDWLPFADTVDALKRLKSRFKLGIISNIDDDLFEHTQKHLQVPFDLVVTAQQVGAYKPSHRNFEEAERRGILNRKTWLHAAESLFHDVAPARELGIRNVWLNRREGKPNAATRTSEVKPDYEVASLRELANLLST